MAQTPSPYHLRKLHWTFFRCVDAASFLNAMVKVRRGFAHQDKAQKPRVTRAS